MVTSLSTMGHPPSLVGPHRRAKAEGIKRGEDGLRAQVDLVVTSAEGGDGVDAVEEGQPGVLLGGDLLAWW